MIHNTHIAIISVFFLLFLHIPSFAQYDNVEFEHITIEDGLPENSITCILQDHLGYLWLGTQNGLAKYDGYNMTVYQPNPDDSLSIGHQYITTIYEDRTGTLWIGAGWNEFGGLNKFDRTTETFTNYLHNTDDSPSINNNEVTSIYEDKAGNFLVGTLEGLNLFDRKSKSFKDIGELLEDEKTVPLNHSVSAIIEDQLTGNLYVGSGNKILILDREMKFLTENYNNLGLKYDLGEINSFYQSNDGSIWIGHSMGLSKFNPQLNIIKHYQQSPYQVFQNMFSHVTIDNYGFIWGGSGNGLVSFDPQNELFQIYKQDPNDPNSISSNEVWSLYKDRTGIIWAGTGWAGLNKWDRNRHKFIRYSYDSNNPNNERFNKVSSIIEDSERIIWFGTENGLYSFNRFLNEFQNYKFDTKDKRNTVTHIYKDGSGIIWFGTATSGLGKFNADRGTFNFYLNDPNDSTTISDNHVYFIQPEGNDIIWIGTWGGGLNRFDKKTGIFTRYTYDSNNPKSLSHDKVACIYNDHTGKLWIGTDGGGVNSIDQTNGSFESFDLEGSTSITVIYEDRLGNIWIGTYTSGIHLFDSEKEISVYNITQEDGLARNQTHSILEDDSGNLWIGTDNGLSRFDPKTRSIKNYFTSDGLEGNRYWFGSSFKTSTGEMLLGSRDGFTIFHPDSIKDDPFPPQVVISKVSLFNRPGEKLTFDGFMSELDELELSYDENDLRFDYVGLHFGEPAKNQYKYMLENFDDDWVDAGTQRNATYTNLDAGEYIFRVTASNRDGVWNEEGVSINIIIFPPWWATIWAYIFYGLIILSIIYFTWKMQLKRIRIKHNYEMSKFEAEKLQEVDGMKSRFFANISHEFRTPLTLIFGPAKDIIDETNETKIKQNAGIIKRNASRLYGLVNQLLDLSKLEAGKMTLEVSEQNIMPLLKGLVLSFSSLAERKKITLNFNTIEENLNVYIDKDKVEKIITNLLSNAFKFTPEGGKIDFTVEKLIKDVEIRIADNGIGIPKERIDKIFDRFFQVDGSQTRENEGTGIGLALKKELVELHKGKIKVESKEGEGTTLTVLLPLGKEHLKPKEIVEKEIPEKTKVTTEESELIPEMENRKEKTDIDALLDTEKPLLLIVEDNSDVRKYIISHLEEDYRIQEAVDGEDGLAQALNHIPDLIISDVMMPKMDGFELCNKLKIDEKTSHIPIIMLTAKATSKDKIEGYETGADDYIMKPFDAAELKVRIKNLIEIRKKLQEKFSSDDFVIPKELSSIDEQFMKKVLEVINKHISEEKFNVEELRRETYMSARNLQRKVMALTGKSPNQFIKSLRLGKARQQIKERKGTISEIAYNFGFGSPAYFTKCFRDEYGYSPSDLIK